MKNTKVEKTFKGLPEKSFYKDLASGETILIKRGERGYYEQREEVRQRDPEELNAMFNVTKAQSEAMFMGSLFGWDSPGSNPAMYDENGEFNELKFTELKDEDSDYEECPSCKELKLNKVGVRNSLSRKDNKTMICNDCGMQEAFSDM